MKKLETSNVSLPGVAELELHGSNFLGIIKHSRFYRQTQEHKQQTTLQEH